MCLNHSQILNIEMVSMALVKTTKSVDYISKTSISDLNIYKKMCLDFRPQEMLILIMLSSITIQPF